jgi:hypothetical protein
MKLQNTFRIEDSMIRVVYSDYENLITSLVIFIHTAIFVL